MSSRVVQPRLLVDDVDGTLLSATLQWLISPLEWQAKQPGQRQSKSSFLPIDAPKLSSGQ